MMQNGTLVGYYILGDINRQITILTPEYITTIAGIFNLHRKKYNFIISTLRFNAKPGLRVRIHLQADSCLAFCVVGASLSSRNRTT